jgi:hypothetical protein
MAGIAHDSNAGYDDDFPALMPSKNDGKPPLQRAQLKMDGGRVGEWLPSGSGRVTEVWGPGGSDCVVSTRGSGSVSMHAFREGSLGEDRCDRGGVGVRASSSSFPENAVKRAQEYVKGSDNWPAQLSPRALLRPGPTGLFLPHNLSLSISILVSRCMTTDIVIGTSRLVHCLTPMRSVRPHTLVA